MIKKVGIAIGVPTIAVCVAIVVAFALIEMGRVLERTAIAATATEYLKGAPVPRGATGRHALAGMIAECPRWARTAITELKGI